MLCNDVRRVVYFFLDGSLGDRKQQDLKSHVDLCGECERRLRVQRRLREFVVKRLAPDSAPDRLRNRLARSIRAFRAEWSQ
jgi:mycothiol system anti-sigma-R factor